MTVPLILLAVLARERCLLLWVSGYLAAGARAGSPAPFGRLHRGAPRSLWQGSRAWSAANQTTSRTPWTIPGSLLGELVAEQAPHGAMWSASLFRVTWGFLLAARNRDPPGSGPRLVDEEPFQRAESDHSGAAADLPHRLDPDRHPLVRNRRRCGRLFDLLLLDVLPGLRRHHSGRAATSRSCTDAPRMNFGVKRSSSSSAASCYPAALPQIITSLRIALGVAWLVIVAAEMVGMDSGLGYLINDARNAGSRYDLVVATMLLIGAIGIVLDFLIRRLEHLRRSALGVRRNDESPPDPAPRWFSRASRKTFSKKAKCPSPSSRTSISRSHEGELVCLLGPSGCGKSTLLNIAGGFEQPDDAARVKIDGEVVQRPRIRDGSSCSRSTGSSRGRRFGTTSCPRHPPPPQGRAVRDRSST